jgi:tRNA threonylcarbamoyladenosine biosynthesis protein TsaE
MQKYVLNEINKLSFPLNKPQIIFLKWDLWAWKTTISKYILNNLLKVKDSINSPTYTYYNKYEWFLDWEKIDIYHFDLYRLENYDEFFAIWAEEIFDNNNWIILVEWPDLIEEYYQADLTIEIFKTEQEDKREINIVKK